MGQVNMDIYRRELELILDIADESISKRKSTTLALSRRQVEMTAAARVTARVAARVRGHKMRR